MSIQICSVLEPDVPCLDHDGQEEGEFSKNAIS